VLAQVQFADGAELARDLQPAALARMVAQMSPDDAAELLRELPREQADQVLQALGERAEGVESLLGYAEQTAGALMSTEFFALEESLTVKEAIERIQQLERPDASFYVYVTSEGQQLVGVLSLRQLIVQSPHKQLRDFMTPDPIRVRTDADQEEVSRVVSRYDLLAVPVVDNTNRLLGVVTVDDVIDVMREEATEDILKLAGTTLEETTFPGPLRAARIRLPWLVAAFCCSLTGIWLLSRFEGVLVKALQVSFFLPTVLGMGGNVANQCAMIVVRGLATGRLGLGQLGRILSHEFGTAMLLASIFGVVLFAAVWWMGLASAELPRVVALGLFASMLISAGIGTLLPMLFRRFGIDPAVASGPLITSSMDVLGILTYFSLAWALL
jgi:magnesium transporter